MNEFQAAMGLCNLKYINTWIEKRKVIANKYLEKFLDFDSINFTTEEEEDEE